MHLKVEGFQGLDLGATPEIAVDLGQIPRLDDDFSAHYAGLLLMMQDVDENTSLSGERPEHPASPRFRTDCAVYDRISKKKNESGDRPPSAR